MATTDNGNRERDIFEAALDIASAEGRLSYLKGACGGDAALLARVQALLQAHEAPEGFLPERPKPGATIRIVTEMPGDRIGRYKLLEQIGEGGCGVVYMAEQAEPIRRRVALKVIKLGMDTKQVVARFEAERQALALMDHPNIAKVLDAGTTDTGRPYFVMELVRGIKITDYCDENRLSTEERLDLFVQVCHAIQHAHQKGVIHRDIKPSNILVTLNDGVRVPKVIDFGIAKAIGQQLTDKTVFTAFEQIIGTPAYMSPEQALMTSLDIDTRSDIYALGVLLYELLTGHTPFDQKKLVAAGLDEMRRIIREQEPARPSTCLSTLADPEQTTVAKRRHSEPPQLIHLLRGDLDWIVMKSLEKDRTRRYETANGLADDVLRHLNNDPVTARPPNRLYRFQKLVRRNKLAFAAASAVTAALVIGLGLSTWLFFREQLAHGRAVAAEKIQNQLRQQAQAEAKKSEQVAQFLKEMLQGVGPSVALGRDTTMLKEILGKTAERVGKDLKDQPEVEIELRNAIGAVYSELGQSDKAQAMHRQALELARKLPGKRRLEVAASLDSLALTTPDDAAASEEMEREALAIRKDVLGDQAPEVASSLNHLGVVLIWRGKLEESEAVQRQALTLRKQMPGEQSAEVADSVIGLGNVFLDLMEPAEAEIMYREALRLSRRVMGNEHPAVAVYLIAVAIALEFQDKLAEAEPLYREALAIRRKLLGNNHPLVASSVAALACSLWSQGKLPEAESLYREALAIRKAIYPSHNLQVVLSGVQLAFVLRVQGKLAEADTLTKETLELERELSDRERIQEAQYLFLRTIRLRVGGRLADAEALDRRALALLRPIPGSPPRDHWLADSLSGLGNVLRSQGRIVETEPLYREALALERGLPPNAARDRQMARNLRDLARIVLERGNAAEAESLNREGIVLLRKLRAHGSVDHDLVNLVASLGDLLRSEGKSAEAETAYREGLSLCGQTLTNEFAARRWLAAGLAGILKNQGKLAEAEALYRETIEVGRKSNNPHELAGTLAGLGDLLRDQGKPAQAESLYREGLDLCRKASPNDFGQRQWLVSSLAVVLRSQGKLAEAEAAYREAVTNSAKLRPNDPASWQWQVNDLMDVLQRQGKESEAEQLQQEMLKPGKEDQANKPLSLETQAILLGRHGRWPEAITNLLRAIQLAPTNHLLYHRLGPLLVLTSDLEDYRQNCQRMLAQFGQTSDPTTADVTAKHCLLLPASGVDLEKVGHLADVALVQGKANIDLLWFQLCKALAEYRQAKFSSAAEWAQKTVAVATPMVKRDAAAYAILAMAQHQLNHAEQAHAALAKAVEITETKMPRLGSGDLGPDWQDWLIAHILLREARELVEGQPVPAGDKTMQ